MTRPSGRGHGLTGSVVGLVTSLAVVASACSAGEERRVDGDRTTEIQADGSRPPPSIGRLRPGEPCPVTRGVGSGEVPPVLDPAGTDAGWYGADDLWVLLTSARALRKFPIFTMEDGELTDEYGKPGVLARRLDGRGRATYSMGGYATETTQESRKLLRWWPTGVDVSTPGCWLITISFRDSVVRIVVRVKTEDGQRLTPTSRA